MKFILKTIISMAAILCLGSFAQAANLQDAFTGEQLNQVAEGAGYSSGEDSRSVEEIVGSVIQTALSLLGVIFLLLMVYGGYNWMTAAGDNGKVDKAKSTITQAVIGLIVVLAAYAISYFVIQSASTGLLKQE